MIDLTTLLSRIRETQEAIAEKINKRTEVLTNYGNDPETRCKDIKINEAEEGYIDYLLSIDKMNELVNLKNMTSNIIDALSNLLRNQNLRKLKRADTRKIDSLTNNHIMTMLDGEKIRQLEDEKKSLVNEIKKIESKIKAIINNLVHLTDFSEKLDKLLIKLVDERTNLLQNYATDPDRPFQISFTEAEGDYLDYLLSGDEDKIKELLKIHNKLTKNLKSVSKNIRDQNLQQLSNLPHDYEQQGTGIVPPLYPNKMLVNLVKLLAQIYEGYNSKKVRDETKKATKHTLQVQNNN